MDLAKVGTSRSRHNPGGERSESWFPVLIFMRLALVLLLLTLVGAVDDAEDEENDEAVDTFGDGSAASGHYISCFVEHVDCGEALGVTGFRTSPFRIVEVSLPVQRTRAAFIDIFVTEKSGGVGVDKPLPDMRAGWAKLATESPGTLCRYRIAPKVLHCADDWFRDHSTDPSSQALPPLAGRANIRFGHSKDARYSWRPTCTRRVSSLRRASPAQDVPMSVPATEAEAASALSPCGACTDVVAVPHPHSSLAPLT